jgi:hypothetical protein
LGNATAAFTLQVYSHVIPGMDQHAADTVAGLFLGSDGPDRTVLGSDSGPDGSQIALEKQLAWARAQASGSSGGTAQICARPIDRRHSPAAQGVCQGICHPLLMRGSNHIARTPGTVVQTCTQVPVP